MINKNSIFKSGKDVVYSFFINSHSKQRLKSKGKKPSGIIWTCPLYVKRVRLLSQKPPVAPFKTDNKFSICSIPDI